MLYINKKSNVLSQDQKRLRFLGKKNFDSSSANIRTPTYYWNLNEGNIGATRLNQAGGINLLDIYGNVDATSGKKGNAAVFTSLVYPGATFLRATNSAGSIGPSDSLTIAFWVSFNNFNNDRFVLGRWVADMVSPNYQLEWKVEVTSPGIRFYTSNDGLDDIRTIEIGGGLDPGHHELTPGFWHFILAEFNRSSQLMTLEIDMDESTKVTAAQTNIFTNSSEAFRVGYNPSEATNLEGNVDEIAIFNTILTPAEKLLLYNASLGRTYNGSIWI